ncbi:MAG TPA: DNA methyltransferase, partial [Ignavibacteriaceae bacterium]|nr:DNA methyltransferase [Ignavibacteriaceae bacterium]
MTKVYHSEIFGLRETKYDWLNKHNIKNVKWKKIVPHPEFYLFIPTDNKLTNQYYSFFKITEIFPVNSVGIVTARDNFVIDFDRKKLERRIEDFRNSKMDNEIIKQTYDINENQSWKIKEQREKLKKDLDWKDSITQIHYRPFDVRWILYHDEMIERSRKEVMIHMLDENIGLIARRQMLPNKPMNYFFISDKMIADGIIRSDNKGSESLFPLYIYLKSSGKKKQKLTQLL